MKAMKALTGFMTAMNVTGMSQRHGIPPKKIGTMLDVAFLIVLMNNVIKAT